MWFAETNPLLWPSLLLLTRFDRPRLRAPSVMESAELLGRAGATGCLMLSNENRARDGNMRNTRLSRAPGAGNSAQSVTGRGRSPGRECRVSRPSGAGPQDGRAPRLWLWLCAGHVGPLRLQMHCMIYALFRANVKLQELCGKLGHNGEHCQNSAWELFPARHSASAVSAIKRGGRAKTVQARRGSELCLPRTFP